MTKLQSRLGGLLVLQLVLAAGLFWNSQQQQQHDLQQPLLGFEKSQVDRIEISDGDAAVTLRKAGDQWQLPDLHQLPIDDNKLDDILTKLAALNSGWPVATTASGRERFEVAEDNFQRHLRLYQGEAAVASLYVGTSPGFRKVHVRRGQEDAIFAVELNSYELPAAGSDWLDKTLLGAGAVTSIKGPDYALNKTDSGWTFVETAPLAAGDAPKLNIEKAEQLAAAMADLKVQAVVEAEPAGDAIALEVTGNNGNWTYRFIQADDNYYVGRSDKDMLFSISKIDYENITTVGMPQLALETQSTEGEADADDTASSS
ncbi:DUF4340 domain-containing protein [Exilibacterium tricleocarpae]|uniref:DUF4340 domain-containing protein n=1 Tax=Exilibacterium tricleocarpae TaxID=2591008 RepID=A0A545U9V6_9GAMM|nr:DUF4340 domain-containing protein [Exilibacterium tricleocarpae]TQV86254.1 DUF4340 domain-containing protein [Exilibacterium tricleocarpae]